MSVFRAIPKTLLKHVLPLGAITVLFIVSASFFLLTGKAQSKSEEKHNADPAIEAAFAPHKALYEIKLVSTRSGSQISNIGGQMFYEWQSSCGGWSTNHRFNLFYEYADSPAMRITSDFTTFESFDGKELNFSSLRKRDGELFEELRGKATALKEDKGTVRYSRPQGLVYALPAGTLFPISHTINLIKQIKAGEKFYTATTFDGSDEEGPVEVNAFIGKPVNALSLLEASPDLDMSMLNTPAWKVRLAFFPLNKPSSESDYEMDLHFHENGIISYMKIEYDDFAIEQKLVAIESLPGGCDKGFSAPELQETSAPEKEGGEE